MRKLFFISFLLVSVLAFGQDKYAYVALDVNAPLSNVDWISVPAKGLKAGYRGFINEHFSAGVDVSYTTYHEYEPTRTYSTNNGAITTDYFKYIYSYTFVLSGQYNFIVGEKENFIPYVGFGLGANNNDYNLYYNAYQDNQRAWGFLARPEAGVLLKFGHRRSLGAMGAVHFDYSTNRTAVFHYPNFSTIGFQVGLMFMN
jgi:hypothetical protein